MYIWIRGAPRGLGGRGNSRGGRGGPQKRGGPPPGAGGPPKRPRFDMPQAPPANGYAPQPPAQGYGSTGNGYGAVAGQPPVSYGSGYSQQGYPQSYQGYETYQQPPDYSQSAGYATAPPPDNRYGAPPVVNSGYADPYGYGKQPPAGKPTFWYPDLKVGIENEFLKKLLYL